MNTCNNEFSVRDFMDFCLEEIIKNFMNVKTACLVTRKFKQISLACIDMITKIEEIKIIPRPSKYCIRLDDFP
ncbi:Uncharacterised protein [Sphingobacterium daejeonense]|nr:Uncharacterised protein [Sphingobacterium daejeonense]